MTATQGHGLERRLLLPIARRIRERDHRLHSPGNGARNNGNIKCKLRRPGDGGTGPLATSGLSVEPRSADRSSTRKCPRGSLGGSCEVLPFVPSRISKSTRRWRTSRLLDWWSADYACKLAAQLQAVSAMRDRLLGPLPLLYD